MSGKIQIPTNTMEQEFANYERRGYQKGLAVNATRITELEAQAAQVPELIASLQTRQREYLALEAQLADAKQANQWQPIETAPKDIPVLVFHNRMVLEAWYSLPWDRFVVSETGGSNLIKPTHWMPLPAPPKPLFSELVDKHFPGGIDAAIADGKAC